MAIRPVDDGQSQVMKGFQGLVKGSFRGREVKQLKADNPPPLKQMQTPKAKQSFFGRIATKVFSMFSKPPLKPSFSADNYFARGEKVQCMRGGELVNGKIEQSWGNRGTCWVSFSDGTQTDLQNYEIGKLPRED